MKSLMHILPTRAHGLCRKSKKRRRSSKIITWEMHSRCLTRWHSLPDQELAVVARHLWLYRLELDQLEWACKESNHSSVTANLLLPSRKIITVAIALSRSITRSTSIKRWWKIRRKLPRILGVKGWANLLTSATGILIWWVLIEALLLQVDRWPMSSLNSRTRLCLKLKWHGKSRIKPWMKSTR